MDKERNNATLNSVLIEKNKEIENLAASLRDLRAFEYETVRPNDGIKLLTHEIRLKANDIEWLNEESNAKSANLNEKTNLIKELLNKISAKDQDESKEFKDASSAVLRNNASVNSKHQHPPPRQPPGIFPNFQPGSRDLYHLNFPWVPRRSNLLHNVKVPSCQLMPHERTFQRQTDVPSLCCSLVTKSV